MKREKNCDERLGSSGHTEKPRPGILLSEFAIFVSISLCFRRGWERETVLIVEYCALYIPRY